jgi:threonine aldolase
MTNRKMRFPTVDLRSDTVTRPTPAMRRAMAEAEVGDDGYGEDPTVNRLEERAAELFAREAALFLASGTMANQAAIHVHVQPGQEVICETRAHVFNSEMAMMAAFSGCIARPIYVDNGILDWNHIESSLHRTTQHRATTGLIVLENTANLAGGNVCVPQIADEVCEQAHAAGVPVHLDGARIFNACVVLGCTAVELTSKFDSVMFCLSKGLGAPVGSMLVGSKQFILEARRVRKMLGGGLRQAGVLAAAGLVALEGPQNIANDHANARFLAEALADVTAVRIDPSKVVTNIVLFEVCGLMDAFAVSRKLADLNVLVNPRTSTTIRLVTHRDVDRDGCERAINALRQVLGNPPPAQPDRN